jgi:hypothetical protein
MKSSKQITKVQMMLVKPINPTVLVVKAWLVEPWSAQ